MTDPAAEQGGLGGFVLRSGITHAEVPAKGTLSWALLPCCVVCCHRAPVSRQAVKGPCAAQLI